MKGLPFDSAVCDICLPIPANTEPWRCSDGVFDFQLLAPTPHGQCADLGQTPLHGTTASRTALLQEARPKDARAGTPNTTRLSPLSADESFPTLAMAALSCASLLTPHPLCGDPWYSLPLLQWRGGTHETTQQGRNPQTSELG